MRGAALRTAMETQVGVEPLVYGLDQLEHPHSLFLAEAITSGKEIFSKQC